MLLSLFWRSLLSPLHLSEQSLPLIGISNFFPHSWQFIANLKFSDLNTLLCRAVLPPNIPDDSFMLDARHSSLTSHFAHVPSAIFVDLLSFVPGKKISGFIPMHSALSSHSSFCILECLST